MNIRTSQIFPGAWYAIYDDTYDGAPDSGPFAHMMGLGQTKQQAIDDLKAKRAEWEELEEKARAAIACGEVAVKDGGPAFPVHPEGASWHNGMSMRDWFAGMALQSIIRRYEKPYMEADDAEWAYSIADAMLAEREK